MDNKLLDRNNFFAAVYWRRIKEVWAFLDQDQRTIALTTALGFNNTAWITATTGMTGINPPRGYADFLHISKFDTDQDGVKEEYVQHSPQYLYSTYPHQCKNTWNNIAIMQILSRYMEIYRTKEEGLYVG